MAEHDNIKKTRTYQEYYSSVHLFIQLMKRGIEADSVAKLGNACLVQGTPWKPIYEESKK